MSAVHVWLLVLLWQAGTLSCCCHVTQGSPLWLCQKLIGRVLRRWIWSHLEAIPDSIGNLANLTTLHLE